MPDRPLLSFYLRHRLLFEVLLSILITTVITATNATSLLIEARFNQTEIDPVLPWLQEITSGLAILCFIPMVFLLLRHQHRFWQQPRFFILRHLALFAAFTTGHLLVMLWLREWLFPVFEIAYAEHKTPWYLFVLYEARKDALVYALLASALYANDFILTRLQGEVNFPSQDQTEFDQQFLVKMLQREYLVKVSEVDWIQSAKNYVLLYCGGRAYPMRSTMQKVLEKLDPAVFARCHRTAIINLTKIEEITQGDEKALLLISGERIPMSKTYEKELEERLISSRST